MLKMGSLYFIKDTLSQPIQPSLTRYAFSSVPSQLNIPGISYRRYHIPTSTRAPYNTKFLYAGPPLIFTLLAITERHHHFSGGLLASGWWNRVASFKHIRNSNITHPLTTSLQDFYLRGSWTGFIYEV